MKSRLPFGPFLAAGAIAYILFGSDVIHWYWGILR
jgi:prepilin signal peptidase PulO-like enzyme (type II secretory pathway)